MIAEVDDILRDLVQSCIPPLAGPTQVGFQAPNQDWRTAVVGAGEERLNVYLFDLRENLKLRSNEFTREQQDGWYRDRQDPPRLDCHYLLTVWSPILVTPMVEPSRDEHGLLYQVAEVLFRHRSIVVADVYAPGITIPSGRTLIPDVPPPLREEELPIAVGLPDTTRDLGEFWNTMGTWRPALHLTVTIPVFPLTPDKESPMVTTEIVDYRQQQAPSSAEVWLSIGGHVARSGSGEVVKGVYVQIQGLNPPDVQIVNRHVITQADGRFRFERLRAGEYRLQAIAGAGSATRIVNLPSGTGEYDLQV